MQGKKKKPKKENLRTDESRREKPPDPGAQRQSLVAVKSQSVKTYQGMCQTYMVKTGSG